MTSIPPELQERLQAGVELIRRTGAKGFQLRFQDDENPTVWIAVAQYDGDRWETAAGTSPLLAVLRLCEFLVDGGHCAHCGRPAALEPLSLEPMPMSRTFCWYQYDPELKTFRRACEGETQSLDDPV